MCKKCGCHFKEDFNRSLRCGFWKERNLQKLSKKNKEHVWNWFFSLESDRIAVEQKIALAVSFTGSKLENAVNEFEKNVEGYKDWSDNERKDFQKEYFKFMGTLTSESLQALIFKNFSAGYKKGKKK